MIDRVHLNYKIKLDEKQLSLKNKQWMKRFCKDIKDKNTGKLITNRRCYIHNAANVKIVYFVSDKSSRLYIYGRLINLSMIKNRVNNLDDIYIGVRELGLEQGNYITQDLNMILNQFNCKLLDLTGVNIKIQDFTTTYVEFCVNLNIGYQNLVEQYITMFNLTFLNNDYKRYINHVLEKELPLHSSCYIKSKGQYEVKARKTGSDIETYGKDTYAINFYNKFDQLTNEYNKNYGKKFKTLPTKDDLASAKGILRMEIKAHYRTVKDVFNKNEKDSTLKLFGDIIDPVMCYRVVQDKYKYFFDRSKDCKLDFCSYQEALKRVNNSDMTIRRKNNLKAYLRDTMVKQGKQYKLRKKIKGKSASRAYINVLKELNIHPVLLPKEFKVDYLKSPYVLLEEKLKAVIEAREQFMEF